MDFSAAQEFQARFKAWLGPDQECGARIVAQRSGYSLKYVRWVAGLIGPGTWPGSKRFIRRMERLGCNERPWRERPVAQIRQAFERREEV